MPVPLRYYAAHTGRWGGDDKLNLQNIPRNSPLKHAIFAPEGYMMIDSDSSQIEARTLAWLAEQNDLVEAFDNGEDVYKIMATAIYNKPISEITKDERFVGKTTILGAGYGMGSAKFQAQLKNFGVEVSSEEAKRIIDTY
jgi:DNA polymerase